MQKEDWEIEYEREKQAAAQGQNVGGGRRKNNNDEDLFAAYYGGGAGAGGSNSSNQKQSSSSGGANDPFGGAGGGYGSTTTSSSSSSAPAPVPAPVSSASSSQPQQQQQQQQQNNNNKKEEDVKGSYLSAYMEGGGGAGGVGVINKNKFPGDDDKVDPRFGLEFDTSVPIPANLRDRVSPYNFFIESCSFYSYAYFGNANRNPALLFITSNSVWVVSTENGSTFAGISITDIATLYAVGKEQGVGFRSKTFKTDFFIKLAAPRREKLVHVLKKLFAIHTEPREYSVEKAPELYVVEGSEEKEKSYRGEIKFHKKGEFPAFTFDCDPRSGLGFVKVPPEHQKAYAPLVPKILHYFGGVFHFSLVSKVLTQQRRGHWLTPNALFLSVANGPGEYGEGITRCIYIEHIRSVIVCDKQLGVVIGGGAPQADLMLEYDSKILCDNVVFVLRRAYQSRVHHPLFVRNVPSGGVASQIKIADETKFKAKFEAMFTVGQLSGHLRTPAFKT